MLASCLIVGAFVFIYSWRTIATSLNGTPNISQSVVLDDPASAKWFILHPILAIMGTVVLPIPAVILRQYKGYWSKKIHAFFFVLSVACIVASMYFIYTNKEIKNKPHLSSWHSLGGAFVVLGYIALFIVGIVALDPDMACITNENTIKGKLKWFHKSGGRMLLVVGYWVCFSGWYKFYTGTELILGAVVASVASVLTYMDPIIKRLTPDTGKTN